MTVLNIQSAIWSIAISLYTLPFGLPGISSSGGKASALAGSSAIIGILLKAGLTLELSSMQFHLHVISPQYKLWFVEPVPARMIVGLANRLAGQARLSELATIGS